MHFTFLSRGAAVGLLLLVLPCARLLVAEPAAGISQREIDREVKRALAGRKADPAALAVLQAQVAKHLAEQRLVLAYLKGQELAASEADVNLEIERLKKKLGEQKVTLATHLQKLDLTEAELRQSLLWQLSWRRYLDQQLTDAALQKYFAAHAREFDGTQLKVAHILLKIPAPPDAKAQASVLAKAKEIRGEITSGKLTFASAAGRYSAAPTANSGGDIGYIGRNEPMPEEFSAAAFALDKGQVSEPVVTTAGVHLIMCLEVKPGNKTWEEVRAPLAAAVSQYLFRWCAEREGQRADRN